MLFLIAFGIVASLQFLSAQFPPNLPEECKTPPVGVDRPQECCKIPPFFRDDDFEDCGFKKLEGDSNLRGPPDCTKQKCMLQRNNLLDGEGEISVAKVRKFLNQYAEEHREFKKAIEVAKDNCVGKNLPGPPQLCEANKLIFCISSTLFSECPVWQTSPACNILINHMRLCKPYFQH